MTLVEHATRELKLLGEDPVYAQSVVCAVAAFSAFGHSGGSAAIAAEQLYTLLRYKPLTPLTDDPDEWHQHSDQMWQNVRRPDAFSTDGGVTHYCLDDHWDPETRERVIYRSAPARPKPAESDSAPAIVGVDPEDPR